MDGWTNYFPDNIGQAEAVNAFNGLIHLEAHSPNPSYKKPIALLGEAGMGKTSLAKKLPGKLEAATNKNWRFVELTPTDSPTNFFTQYQDKVVNGIPTVIFIDEIHGIKKGAGSYRLEQAIKRLLETDRQVTTVSAFLGQDVYSLHADPYNHIHICATNEEVDDEALVGANGRYRPIYIAPYTYNEIAQLIILMGERAKMDFTDGALEYLSKRVKGSGRAIDCLVESLQYECVSKIDLDAARRTAARDKRFPDGLDQKDVAALQFLSKRKNVSAGEISATLREHENMTKNRLRVLAGSLHCVSTGRGRFSLSDEGKAYLELLVKLQTEASKLKVANATI